MIPQKGPGLPGSATTVKPRGKTKTKDHLFRVQVASVGHDRSYGFRLEPQAGQLRIHIQALNFTDSYLNCLKPPTWFAGNPRSSMARDLSWVPANGMQDQQKGG